MVAKPIVEDQANINIQLTNIHKGMKLSLPYFFTYH